MKAEHRARIEVRVTPGSRESELGNWRGGVLSVKLKARPEKGRANAELCRFLAESLGVAASDVRLLSGSASRLKRLVVEGISNHEVRRRLGG